MQQEKPGIDAVLADVRFLASDAKLITPRKSFGALGLYADVGRKIANDHYADIVAIGCRRMKDCSQPKTEFWYSRGETLASLLLQDVNLYYSLKANDPGRKTSSAVRTREAKPCLCEYSKSFSKVLRFASNPYG